MDRWNSGRVATRVRNFGHRLIQSTPRQLQIRRTLRRTGKLRWWLVYGAPRSGTSYMYDLVKQCARLHTSDWGLGEILAAAHQWRAVRSSVAQEWILFDWERLLRDLSANILDNAYAGLGDQIDLVYKQAKLEPDEILILSAMWGPPERTIMCLREPAGFMASAARKFPTASVEDLQQNYVKCLDVFWQAGGDLFEYGPGLTTNDYVAFLRPLRFQESRLTPFEYRGKQDLALVTDAMWEAYHRVQAVAADHEGDRNQS